MSVHAEPSFAPRAVPCAFHALRFSGLSMAIEHHAAHHSTALHASHLRREQVAIEVYHSKVPVNKSSTDLLAITASTSTARMTARGMALLTDYAIGFSFIYDEQGVLKVRMRTPRDGRCCDVGPRVLTCMHAGPLTCCPRLCVHRNASPTR